LFCPANLGVIAADHSLDLAGRTAAIVHEQDLSFPHRPHGRLFFTVSAKQGLETLNTSVAEMKPIILIIFLSFSTADAVGTLITERPPHKAVQAACPHTASTLGV
jgi:hypothetical protein